MRLIIASGSKNRLSALNLAHIKYSALAADIDEKAIRHEQPRQLVLALAHAKADAIIQQLKQQHAQ